MFMCYLVLDEDIAQFDNVPQSSIGETIDHMPWYRPSECFWIVPGTVDSDGNSLLRKEDLE